VIPRPRPGRRRLASLVVVIGLLGACAVLVVLIDSPGGSPAATGSADRAGTPARPPATPATPAAAAGLRLMEAAAAACGTVAFYGVQVDSWPAAAGRAAERVQVWHQPGQAVLAQYAAGADRPAGRSAAGTELPDQADVLTITAPLLTLMRQHYVLTYAGPGRADGRAARVIEVRRPAGGLAARYWLDRGTGLPLRRELYDQRARVLAEVTFAELRLGMAPAGAMPSAAARPWPGQLTAARRAALRAAGWPLPRAAAGDLSLFAATQTATPSGRVVELSYSDGLSVVSVFVQRGELPARLPGWRPIAGPGHEVYAMDPGDQSVAWSAGGYVVTVISDASAGAAARAVTVRPAARPPGFWSRMARGFRRLLSWANPLR
jgi:sigma-E factor negative regulatory protein RseB